MVYMPENKDRELIKMKINVNESFDILIGRHSSRTCRSYCVELLMLCMIKGECYVVFQIKKYYCVLKTENCPAMKICTLCPNIRANIFLQNVGPEIFGSLDRGKKFWHKCASLLKVFWKSFDILESLQLHCRDNCSRHPHHGKWFFMIMTRIPGFFQVLRMATGVPSNMSALPWEWWPWWSLIMVSIWFNEFHELSQNSGNSVHHTPINHSKDWDTEFCFVSEAQIVQTPIGQIVILLPAATDDDDDGDEASTWITIWSNENLQKLRLHHPRNSSPIVILEFQSLGL